jgi:hypothetical protein
MDEEGCPYQSATPGILPDLRPRCQCDSVAALLRFFATQVSNGPPSSLHPLKVRRLSHPDTSHTTYLSLTPRKGHFSSSPWQRHAKTVAKKEYAP